MSEDHEDQEDSVGVVKFRVSCAPSAPKCPPMRRRAWYCICPKPTRVMWGGTGTEDPDVPPGERIAAIDAAELAAAEGKASSPAAPPAPALPKMILGYPARSEPCSSCSSTACRVVTPKGVLYACRGA